MSSEAMAAWVQAIGSILAICATWLAIRYERHLERADQEKENRVRALGLATDLDLLLMRISSRLDFRPDVGDGPLTREGAHAHYRLSDREVDGLRIAAKDAFLFSSPAADEIILLSAEAARYQRVLDTWAEKLVDCTTYLERTGASIESLNRRLHRVRTLIQRFLPQEAAQITDLGE